MMETQKQPDPSKAQQLKQALLAGERLTGVDIWGRFGLYHPAEPVRRMRAKGFPILTRKIPQKRGAPYGEYSIPPDRLEEARKLESELQLAKSSKGKSKEHQGASQ